MADIEFYHGILTDTYEKQANRQGYTLGEKAEEFEEIALAFHSLVMHGLLTDGQADDICRKIQKQLAAGVKPLEGNMEGGK